MTHNRIRSPNIGEHTECGREIKAYFGRDNNLFLVCSDDFSAFWITEDDGKWKVTELSETRMS